ncbi:hypothetical protein ES708_31062 [subsurface metagenome]
MGSLLLKNWVCCKCGAALPTGGLGYRSGRFGYIWRYRYQEYLNKNQGKENPQSGLYCDSCADARESGLDY